MPRVLSTIVTVDRHVLSLIASYLSDFPFDVNDVDNFLPFRNLVCCQFTLSLLLRLTLICRTS